MTELAPASTSAAGSTWLQVWGRFKTHWPWLLGALVVFLLVRQSRSIDWPQVWQALLAQPPSSLVWAAALALLSFLVFASFDLIGRRATQHAVSAVRTVGIAATCYAFNLNFGSLVGALALKLRLYAQAGLHTPTVVRIIALSIATNWLGYLAVGGLILLFAPPPMPAQVQIPDAAAQAVGAGMLAVCLGYLVMCARRPHTSFRWRTYQFDFPGVRMALWQLGVASSNWLLMALIVWLLLQQQVPYWTALGVLLLAAIAGVVTHVPAGLGVIEAVFLSSLGGQMAQPQLLAALLAYRVSYYLFPLALAGLGYLGSELAGGLRRETSTPDH